MPLMGFTSCGLFGGGADTSLARVDDLITWVERVHVNSELSREKAQAAIDRLQLIAASNFGGDPLEAYKGLVETIGQSEQQANVLRSSVRSMEQTAGPVFEKWTTDLMQFSSPQMRLRSQNRLLATRQRYDAIIATVGPAQESLDGFNRILRDHALFLGHDLNPASVAEIAEDVRALTKQAGQLDSDIDACLKAARDYVERSALPVTTTGTTTTNPPPAPGGGARVDRPRTNVRPEQVRTERVDMPRTSVRPQRVERPRSNVVPDRIERPSINVRPEGIERPGVRNKMSSGW